ncbi:hypothetical protein C7M84_014096 [Penaeus vannamei]|uniref:Uncharacterized protein n=1 Tax=Penaeus vannamei TaxID=6689 RepID=A0A423SUF1_PENVA|nr:hypothetical protein C7M84_014096 [Penaeus vannamei]
MLRTPTHQSPVTSYLPHDLSPATFLAYNRTAKVLPLAAPATECQSRHARFVIISEMCDPRFIAALKPRPQSLPRTPNLDSPSSRSSITDHASRSLSINHGAFRRLAEPAPLRLPPRASPPLPSHSPPRLPLPSHSLPLVPRLPLLRTLPPRASPPAPFALPPSSSPPAPFALPPSRASPAPFALPPSSCLASRSLRTPSLLVPRLPLPSHSSPPRLASRPFALPSSPRPPRRASPPFALPPSSCLASRPSHSSLSCLACPLPSHSPSSCLAPLPSHSSCLRLPLPSHSLLLVPRLRSLRTPSSSCLAPAPFALPPSSCLASRSFALPSSSCLASRSLRTPSSSCLASAPSHSAPSSCLFPPSLRTPPLVLVLASRSLRTPSLLVPRLPAPPRTPSLPCLAPAPFALPPSSCPRLSRPRSLPRSRSFALASPPRASPPAPFALPPSSCLASRSLRTPSLLVPRLPLPFPRTFPPSACLVPAPFALPALLVPRPPPLPSHSLLLVPRLRSLRLASRSFARPRLLPSLLRTSLPCLAPAPFALPPSSCLASRSFAPSPAAALSRHPPPPRACCLAGFSFLVACSSVF